MKILIVGAGVIGSIYGYALAQAGNDVTHYVRPGKKAALENGIHMRLLDGRKKNPQDEDLMYRLKAVETLSPDDGYDLIIVSVRHYQLESVLPLVQQIAGTADILFFNGNWEGFDLIERYLPGSSYLWGFPVAGGGFTGQHLDAALLDEIHLGEIDGNETPRLARIRELFEQAGLKVDVQESMLHWLWVHFAINCGVIGAAFKARGADELLNSIPALRQGILAGREALAVCRARGVDVDSFEDAKSFMTPAWLGAVMVWFMMKTNLPARKIFTRHTNIDELQHMYYDLLKTGEQLNVRMPHYQSLKRYIDNPPTVLGERSPVHA
ncbi:MAG TPA: 2-dehydropantoate 2-reductase N-terminal domain-containing protein [Anaerolineaceae bacterium]|nr:2-dehydropantoate 2-reductase N-terminal domain-containing protein [Anaerolineaceae bacterium]